MLKRIALALLHALLVSSSARAGPALTEMETRWLEAGGPVLAYAREQGLPLDVLVQPQPRPGDVPFAMAFVAGRCKLVLSMRGRADDEAERPLHGVAAALQPIVIEAITAHEVAHCWRHVQGGWRTLPAGFVDADGRGEGAAGDLAGARGEMLQVRREEGYADLVGLAWTARRHPGQYAAVHAWLSGLRAAPPVEGGHHDTRIWLREVEAAAAFAAAAAATPFEAAWPVWLKALPAPR